MSQVLFVGEARRDAIIAEAADRRTPVVLTRHDGSGWRTYKSRFVGCSEVDRQLYVEQPAAAEAEPGPSLVCGELVGVAFRRGHKKCLFNTVVRTMPAPQPGSPIPAGALAVGWPDDMQELQRRVYQRACPPPDRPIKVRFRSAGSHSSGDRDRVGIMDNLSAGGMRVRCADDGGFQTGDDLKVAFALGRRGPEFVLEATFRHCEPRPDGSCSLGFQFVGLETSRQGQETLVRLSRMVTDFQRAALRRRPRRLRPQAARG